MRFLFLEPFFGGSHRQFAEGWIKHSHHRIDLLALPARYWKWRMRGAALHFIHQIDSVAVFDGIIGSSLLSLADFKALAGRHCPPLLVYFHENQLTYPLAPGERMDYHYGFTDITTALCAERVLFNSCSHRRAFLDRLPRFIGRMPEYKPHWATGVIAAKSDVLHPGCDFDAVPASIEPSAAEPPLIIWNHRWEFDKNPEAFFRALEAVDDQGIDFRLAVLGEQFQRVPAVFESARKRFEAKIVQWGRVASRDDYYAWLVRGGIIVSTALQENFGLAVVEAMRMGCLPLLPRRLCYPEILPEAYHAHFLYNDSQELIAKLAYLLTGGAEYASIRRQLSEEMAVYAWPHAISRYDTELDRLARLKANRLDDTP